MSKIKLPREAKIQFRAVPDILYSIVEYRLEYRVDPNDTEHRYKEDIEPIFFGLIKRKQKIDYSNYWLGTSIFTGYAPEESSSHYLNWSLGIEIKDQNELMKYKNKYKTIGEFEDYLNGESNINYDKWKNERERFFKESQKILY